MISKKVVNLPVKIFDTRAEMGVEAAKDAAKIINEAIAKNGVANVVFAAAPSQNDLLENLFLFNPFIAISNKILVFIMEHSQLRTVKLLIFHIEISNCTIIGPVEI